MDDRLAGALGLLPGYAAQHVVLSMTALSIGGLSFGALSFGALSFGAPGIAATTVPWAG